MSETYTLGPADGKLTVHTTRQGVAAKVGHDLDIEVGSWEATLTTSDPPTFELTADSTSLQIVDGHRGVKPLSDKDRKEIRKNIDAKILKQQPIRYKDGQLELVGTSRPCPVEVSVGDGRFSASVTIVQSEWGIKPYTGLMGALKVADEVQIKAEGRLPG
jgi:polyisoprenoid-binding protein YceI